MRLTLASIRGLVAGTALFSWVMAAAAADTPALSPGELVRHAVRNEANDSGAVKFMFCERKETSHGSQTKLMVETHDAMAAIVIANDGHPLSPQQQQAEIERVGRFVNDPSELRKKQKQENEDSERVSRIVRALPDALLYENDGHESARPGVGQPGNDLVRLKFHPNPKYDPPSHVEQVLTGMEGSILVDPVKNRIARIDGTLAKEVGFGWGILGHLDRGSRFVVEQGDVGENQWEITRMDLSVTGKVLLFKSLNFKSTQVYTDFHPVPSGLTFAQGVELLKKQEAVLAQNGAQVRR